MAPAEFKSRLEASSYLLPGGGELYRPLREKVVQTALAMGFERDTMVEHGVQWAEDQDPFGHVHNAVYQHFTAAVGTRIFESFEEQLGNKISDLLQGRGIGVLVRDMKTVYKRPLIIACKFTEVKEDRYFGTMNMWSLRTQAVVVEAGAWIVFFDFNAGKPADMLKLGGVYADLQRAIVKRSERSAALAASWEKNNAKEPPKEKL